MSERPRALEPDLRRTIVRGLALAERRLWEAVDEPRAGLCLTRLEDVVADLDEVLRPLRGALAEAATEMALPAQQGSHRAAARAVLSIVWADLMELDPDRLRRGYGSDDVPTAWPAIRERLITAVEHALARLEP